MSFIVCLLAILGSIVSGQEKSCQDVIQTLTMDLVTKSKENTFTDLERFFKYSGIGQLIEIAKRIQDWGDYEACLRSDAQVYYDVFIVAPPPVGELPMGMCFPAVCKAEELQSLIPNLKTTISTLTQTDTSQLEIKIQAPETLYKKPVTGTYLTFCLILVLFALSLIKPIDNGLTMLLKADPSRSEEHLRQLFQNNKLEEEVSEINYGIVNSEQDIVEIELQAPLEEEKPKKSQPAKPNQVSPLNNAAKESDQQSKQAMIQRKEAEVDYLEMFSIVENWKELTNCTVRDQNLTIFDGLRTFAFCMVVFGHQFEIGLRKSNMAEALVQLGNWMGLLILDCFYSVDIFFWIGGFFLGYVSIEPKNQLMIRKSKFTAMLMMVVHRVLRIWPSYIVTLLIVQYTAALLGEGPRWYQALPRAECPRGILNNILFIQIYEHNPPGQTPCMAWGWYLATDMWLFLAGLLPIFVYVVYQKQALGKILILGLLMGTQLIGTVQTFQNEYQVYTTLLGNLALFIQMLEDYYYKPWCRGPPYYLGLLLGVCYREMKNYKAAIRTQNQGSESFTKPWMAQLQDWSFADGRRYRATLLKWALYLLGGYLFYWLNFGWRPVQLNPTAWSKEVQMLYFSQQRLLVAFSLTLVTLVGCLGISDGFNTDFMGNYAFRFITKISFSAYLIHYFIVETSFSTFYETPQMTHFGIVQFFVGNLIITLIGATLLTLLVEMPFGKLEKQLTSKLK